nr:hypothetical protein [Tanacetum cinerariifolium]
MSTQHDIYVAGSESRPPMLNKENYMPWSSRLLRYAKSRPNGKLIHNSIINGPYLRRMIPEPGDTNRDVPVNETFHVQTDDKLTKKELKQIEADDQVIQTILLGLPEDIYAAVDSCETAQEISPHQDQPSFNQNYMQQPIPNPEDIIDPTTAMNMALALMAKAFKLNYSTLTNNNQGISSNPRNRNLTGYNDVQNVGNQVVQNAAQNPRVQNIGNQNGLVDILGNANLNGNGNVVAARAEGNPAGPNGNQIRCYNCRGVGHFARNCTVRPRRRDAAYLQTQLLIAHKEEAGIQLQAEEYDLMAAAADLDEIDEVNANCILMANLQQASTSGTQTDRAPVYDSDGSAEVHDYENCDDNEIFNMFTQEEQYTELLEPIPKPHQVPQNDNNVIFKDQSIQTIHMLSPKPDSFYHTEQKMALGNQNPFYLKQAQKKQQSLYDGKVLLEKHDPLVVHDSEETLQLAQETKFVGDFKSLAKEVDESLAKQNALELEIERLLRAVVSQDIMCVVQKTSVVVTSDLQTKLEQNLPKIDETHALSKPVTSKSVSTPQESKVMKNDKVIAPGMFRINPFKTSKEEKHVPNNVSASARTKPITISQPPVFTKKDVNSDSNGLSSTGVDNTKTRRPQPRSNTKNDRVPSASKSSQSKHKGAKVEEHHMNLLLSKNTKHMSSVCNNIKLDSQNVISKVVCAMCKQCLISVNHDVCLRNYENGKVSHGKKHKANVSIKEKQKKHQPQVKKSKKVGFLERLATPKPRKPRFLLRWSPTGRLFDQKGKIVYSSESENQSDCSNGDNACTSNTLEPKIKWFRNSTSLLGRVYFVEGLGHNLFSIGQLCDSDLEVAFRRNACFVRNLDGVDLLKGDRSTNLYTINLHEMASASPICLMARLLKFKYHKEHLCPSCEQGKSKSAFHPPKPVPNSRRRLHLLHMDLCGPMRIASINGKWYVLVIVDDYSRYTCVHFLRSKDKAPEVIKTFMKRITVLLQKLGAKGDIGFFIGYSADSYAYKIYNRRTKKIIETINVSFDELSAMAFEQRNSKPGLQSMTSGQISSGLDLTYAPSTITTQQPNEGELNLLFEAMYDDYIGGQPSATARTILPA